ncbi:MAG: GNAT family N-acetyltransferase [Lachnospiraceae bacterium]
MYKEQIDVDAYLHLREQVGWPELKREQAKKALDNSLIVLCGYHEDKPVGMGRLVGDGAVICYIQDLIVLPEAQGKGVGSRILDELRSRVADMGIADTTVMLDLMCAKGREQFYEKHGFLARPTAVLGPGMIQYVQTKPEK